MTAKLAFFLGLGNLGPGSELGSCFLKSEKGAHVFASVAALDISWRLERMGLPVQLRRRVLQGKSKSESRRRRFCQEITKAGIDGMGEEERGEEVGAWVTQLVATPLSVGAPGPLASC